ncbi:hypothetical protein N9K26_02445 [Flavobacteriales bacterium]|jgi:hypothetical protein|nr:hypothetical protein [Flavobacteriales bacterium]MDB4051881.1 hypothetical protein [Flavobacteriales bacterium]MDG1175538.1 hypothetical protein [Flavobacteriales bacterium]
MKNLLIIIASLMLVSLSVSCKKKGCTNEYCDTYNEKAKKDDGSCECNEGAASFYVTKNDGQVDIFIDDVKQGTITEFFEGDAPTCGQDGTLKIELSPGVYQMKAVGILGAEWNRQIEISEGECSLQILD